MTALRLSSLVLGSTLIVAAPKPPSIAKSFPTSAAEKQRAAVFQRAQHAVVFIRAALPPNSEAAHQRSIKTGTGFVWDELGHVVTNYHVIAMDDPAGNPWTEATSITVTLKNGKAYKAKVIGRSLAYNLAVLHVFAPLAHLRPLPMGTSKTLRVGQSVLAMGNAFGLHNTLTKGIISNLGRELPTPYQTPIQDIIQTDTSINPGDSGGPLMDMAGRLIGMNMAIATTSGCSAGVAFAIPADTLNRVVPKLIEKQQQGWPELGFTLLRPSKALELGIQEGLAVMDVQQGSYARKAGLQAWRFEVSQKGQLMVQDEGDLIVGLNHQRLFNELHFFVLMEKHPKGQPFVLDVLRSGRRLQIHIDPWRKTSATDKSEH